MNAKDLLKTFVLSAALFAIPMSTVLALMTSNLLAGGVLGVVAGGMFGAGISLFLWFTNRDLAVAGEVWEGERLLHAGPVNLKQGLGAEGGRLYLTATRLSFRSHGYNLKNLSLELSLQEIQGVSKHRSLWFFDNGLLVERSDGELVRFVVHGPDLWVKRIHEALSR